MGEDTTLGNRYQHVFQSFKEKEKSNWLSKQNCNLLSYKEGYQEKQADWLSHIPESQWQSGVPGVRLKWPRIRQNGAERAGYKVLHKLPETLCTTCTARWPAFSLSPSVHFPPSHFLRLGIFSVKILNQRGFTFRHMRYWRHAIDIVKTNMEIRDWQLKGISYLDYGYEYMSQRI